MFEESSRPDPLLASPLGRELQTGYVGYGPEPGVSDSFGFSPSQEALWGLTAWVRTQLRPVAQALLAAPGARGWWDPVRLDEQRLVEWDGEPLLRGPALEQAVRDHVWLRDMTVSRRRLGRWESGPHYGSWNGPPPEWHQERPAE